MTLPPEGALGVILTYLGFASNSEAKYDRVPTDRNFYRIPEVEGEAEEVVVYTSDNIDLKIVNYGLAPLAADLPEEAWYALGGYFEHLLEDPYGEVDQGWGYSPGLRRSTTIRT